MDITHSVDETCIVKDALCSGGLAGIDMRRNTYITSAFEWISSI